jgi:hypothetical protein
MSKNLQLSLKTKWFLLTRYELKTEDYRELNKYWFKRLMSCSYPEETKGETDNLLEDVYFDIINGNEPSEVIKAYFCKFKNFETNTMTLGYPKSTDTDRIIKFEHAGIEIRTGNPEWGAEPGKLYFVIKHGKRL